MGQYTLDSWDTKLQGLIAFLQPSRNVGFVFVTEPKTERVSLDDYLLLTGETKNALRHAKHVENNWRLYSFNKGTIVFVIRDS